MAHYDTFRVQIANAHPAFGHALWNPDPGEQYPQAVEVGDVGFVFQGKFIRLFNALHSGAHPTNGRFGVSDNHERLPFVPNHIDHGTLHPNNFCSYGVTTTPGGPNIVLAAGPPDPGSAEVSFSCTRRHGAVLSLPVAAQRVDTLAQARFRRWIIRHIDSWFAFSQRHGLDVEMEDIVLVTGCHRTRSWSNIAFYESRADAQVSFGVQVPSNLGSTVNWQASGQHVQGATLSHGPSGVNLPENQCIFVRGFRVKRTLKLFPRVRGAAEPTPDSSERDDEPETELVSIPSFTECPDPLHVLLDYIAKRTPDCDFVLVHDDDLNRILQVSDGTSLNTLQPDVMMNYLEKSQLEIGVMTDSLPSNDQSHGTETDTEHVRVTVAMLSEQLKSLDPSSVPLLSRVPVGTTNNEDKSSGESAQGDVPSSPSALAPPAASSEPDVHASGSGDLPGCRQTEDSTRSTRSLSGDEKRGGSLPPSPRHQLQPTCPVDGDESGQLLGTTSLRQGMTFSANIQPIYDAAWFLSLFVFIELCICTGAARSAWNSIDTRDTRRRKSS